MVGGMSYDTLTAVPRLKFGSRPSSTSSLDTLFKAIVLNKILYALPVYYGYLTEGQKGVLQRVLDRATSRAVSYTHLTLPTKRIV